MDHLKRQHKYIAKLIGNNTVAYIDIPTYFNVGDILIYKGTEEFFKQYNINVVYRSGTLTVDMAKVATAEVILLQGGGNFGDLYTIHQKLRESIVNRFNSKKIICLPQSLHFQSQSALNDSAKIFKQHPDFHFFVRDQISFDIAQKFSHHVMLMPDMAHSLHPLVDMREVGPSNILPPRILNMNRTDKEAPTNKCNVNKLGFDWMNLITTTDQWTRTLYLKMIKIPFLRDKATSSWARLCDDIVFRSINYFSDHTIVYTDRLHGLILSTLLGKEVYLRDNTYGKNINYYKAWLNEYPYVELADNSSCEQMQEVNDRVG